MNKIEKTGIRMRLLLTHNGGGTSSLLSVINRQRYGWVFLSGDADLCRKHRERFRYQWTAEDAIVNLMGGSAVTRYNYGNRESSNVLIQMVDDHDLSGIEREVNAITEKAGDDFYLVAMKINDWNCDLSPWHAPAVFGNEAFGGRAEETLSGVLAELTDSGKRYFLGGYSLAGLFALWAAFRTDRFEGIAAASPSVWFPGFVDFMRTHSVLTRKVYLSLGDREEKTRNPVMASVGDCIRAGYEILQEKGIASTLIWNKGGHFRDADIRTAAAFAWVMKAQGRPPAAGR